MIKNRDRWSALSMKDRADLIKLYVGNGVTSLDEIRRDYNSFATGGDTENTSDSNWTLLYKDLPNGYKQVVTSLAKELNYDIKNIEKIYNSGILKAPIQARFRGAPTARVRSNDSPTKNNSEALEDEMNKLLFNSKGRRLPNMKYAIPYIEELEVKVPGVGRTTTNALDSLAKYAYEARIPLEEAIGIAAQETVLGALPLYNYGDENVSDRALGNASYFRNYGIIPAENFVRDFRYNVAEDPISRDIPPLLHAFEYWKKGNYNRGDPNHTSDVRNKGRAVMNTKVIQEWVKNSELAQKALSLFK